MGCRRDERDRRPRLHAAHRGHGEADRGDATCSIPRQNILAGARYLRDLKGRVPARIQEPDRTWLALAAYNIGLGHLEDARVLAQRQGLDPDHWTT